MASSMLNTFKQQAQRQVERIPSATLQLDVGQYVTGKVRKMGVYIHPEYGRSPVVVFEPEEQETNVPTCMLPGAKKATAIDKLPEDHAYVLVGLGTVLSQQLAKVRPLDYAYIERHEDGKSSMGVYTNWSTMVQRGGKPPMNVDDLDVDDAVDRLKQADLVDSDEEPF